MKKKKIVIIGGGGHGKVVIDAIKCAGGFEIYGIVDAAISKGTSVSGVPVVGGDEALRGIYKKGIKQAIIGVGSIGDCEARKTIYKTLKKIGFTLAKVIHPKAIVAGDAKIGEGAFIAAGVTVNPGTRIRKNVILNTRSSVDHDCDIGDFVHIAPGIVLSGTVKVGEETHIGTGARVIQGINIGRRCMVGAGSIVRSDLKDNARILPLARHIQKRIGEKVFIIAEAGVNHNGDLETAKKMVDAAKEAGADAVKFQTFKAKRIISKSASKAIYQKKSTGKAGSQLEMVKKLELDADAHKRLVSYCGKKGIIFLSSPFDLESIDLLNSLGLDIFKIPSGEITDLPYLRKIGGLRKKVIMSTGMAGLDEVKQALRILTKAGTKKENIAVLHCNTEYPTPYEDANLFAILSIKEDLKVDVGYSDHTLGIEVPVAAAALGASIIEKHFTLDRHMKGPDHRASLEPDELKFMVRSIRNIEKALGSGIKKPSPSELKNRGLARKSIVAQRFIRKGERFTDDNITTKRPADGICSMEWDEVAGRTAKRDFVEDELIEI